MTVEQGRITPENDKDVNKKRVARKSGKHVLNSMDGGINSAHPEINSTSKTNKTDIIGVNEWSKDTIEENSENPERRFVIPELKNSDIIIVTEIKTEGDKIIYVQRNSDAETEDGKSIRDLDKQIQALPEIIDGSQTLIFVPEGHQNDKKVNDLTTLANLINGGKDVHLDTFKPLNKLPNGSHNSLAFEYNNGKFSYSEQRVVETVNV